MIAMKQLENDSARIANETIRLANDKARDAENAKVTAMVMAQNQQLMKSNQELARSNQMITSQFMSFTTMVMDRFNQGQAIQASSQLPFLRLAMWCTLCVIQAAAKMSSKASTHKSENQTSVNMKVRQFVVDHSVIIIIKILDLVKRLNFFEK